MAWWRQPLLVLLLAAVSAAAASAAAGSCIVDAAKGCFLENEGAHGFEGHCPVGGGECGRCLSYYVGAKFNGATSRENCACLCHQHGYTLAGVENGNNCYCGSERAFPGNICGAATTSGCDVACDANRTDTCGGRLRMEVFGFSCAGSCTVMPHPNLPPQPPPPPSPRPADCRPAMGMRCGLPHWTPGYHPAPPCYQTGGAHDIAGALYHAPTKTWHLMAGCWGAGGWQHMTSFDLVSWTVQGKPLSFGGTGGLVHDDDGTIVAYAMTGKALHFWKATDEHATEWIETGTNVTACCNDPIVWKAGGTWYAITAQHGEVASKGPNYGDETYFSSPVLCGPGADWRPLPLFFMDRASLLVPGHNMTHEFVSPDFFQNISGDPSNTASVFLTSTYGPLADKWQSNNGLYNYALFFIGSQPAGAGTPFLPQDALTTAVDWSPFSPHAATPGGLDVATGWGPTQYGCCPKTVADPPTLTVADGGRPRRVMLGWLQNGCSSRGSGIQDGHENSLTLPRELSLAPPSPTTTVSVAGTDDGLGLGGMRQQYIPELQALRDGAPHTITATPFPPPPTAAAWSADHSGFSSRMAIEGVSGAQLEISATIKYDVNDKSRIFGLSVLSSAVEHTDIGIDLALQQVFIDRRNSSANRTDVDVRAGPLPHPKTFKTPGELTLHAYVDHSIVTVIVENQTALTVWVHPFSPNSTNLALFQRSNPLAHAPASADDGAAAAAGEVGPMVTSMEVWQMKTIPPAVVP